MFKANNPGCPCCEGGCEISVSVRVRTENTNVGGSQTCGTRTFLPGATVEVRRADTDALMGSAVSDSGGLCTITFDDPDHPGVGTDIYKLLPGLSPRWSAAVPATTHALACGPNGMFDILIGPASGYRCVATCNDPVKAVLHLTDVNGTWDCTHNDNASIPPGREVWRACYTKSEINQHVWNGSACQSASATVAVEYQLQPAFGGKWQVTQKWTSCNNSTIGAPGTCDAAHRATVITGVGGSQIVAVGPVVQSAQTPAAACAPLNLTFTLGSGNHVIGSVTISE